MQLTLQGEGANTGRTVILVRFTGCNLKCAWCDTDHSEGKAAAGGGTWKTPHDLANTIIGMWPDVTPRPVVLCTGGEPLLQLDKPLIDELKRRGAEILLETNGTFEVPALIDWVCVSPKDDSAAVTAGDEVKLVWPSPSLNPDLWVERDFTHFWLQPMFDKNYDENLNTCIRYCLEDPRWRLSLQTHRFTGIP